MDTYLLASHVYRKFIRNNSTYYSKGRNKNKPIGCIVTSKLKAFKLLSQSLLPHQRERERGQIGKLLFLVPYMCVCSICMNVCYFLGAR